MPRRGASQGEILKLRHTSHLRHWQPGICESFVIVFLTNKPDAMIFGGESGPAYVGNNVAAQGKDLAAQLACVGGGMSKPLLLWFDWMSGLPDEELRIRSASVFEVAQCESAERAAADIERLKPSVLCFNFDYPDQNRLRAMQEIKQSNARLPVLMLTLDHSEMLAVWAFRARVWNYLVKPVSPAEFSENLHALANIGSRASPPRVAQLLNAAVPSELPVQPIAPEVARLQPALHHVKHHYHEKVLASAAAKSCGLTRFEFSRRFKAAFGMTFREYLLRVRLTEARRLLTEGRTSVTAVGFSVGFNDGSHFARMFRRYTGKPPSEYAAGEMLAQDERSQSGGAPQKEFRRRATDRPDSAIPAT